MNLEISEILDGFEQRMKYMSIVRCLTEHTRPDVIRDIISDDDMLNNCIMAVLVYIMEHNLRYDAECTIDNVSSFLREFLILNETDPESSPVLAKYIVVNVLQNSGIIHEFPVFSPLTMKCEKINIRLINDVKGRYHLTDDAYEFLFRTKEIDSELDFSVARFKLHELLKRGNYNDALRQSRELVSKIRTMKSGINDFIQRCRENISQILIDEYEKIINKIHTILSEESNELESLEKNVQLTLDAMNQTDEYNRENNIINQNIRSMNEIVSNIRIAINEQRSLMNRQYDLSKQYQQLLLDNMYIRSYKRFNLEQELLDVFRKKGSDTDKLCDFAQFILGPFGKPRLKKYFSISDFYDKQSLTDKELSDNEIVLESEDDQAAKLIDRRNELHLGIIKSLFIYIQDHSRFTVSEYLHSLTLEEFENYCDEQLLPGVLLALYDTGRIDIDSWKSTPKTIIEPNGEFELAWCLSRLPDELLEINAVNIIWSDKTTLMNISDGERQRKIEITDFIIEVSANE
ncbi:MAG: hypothetical protein Q4F95_05280 [Oscillospiraceae bacterium]|nr:hypothetical protein [Oscillospiraceae bacterium]